MAQLPESEMKCLFVTQKVLVEKVGMIVEPVRQSQCIPGSLPIDQHLSAFEFLAGGAANTANLPDQPGFGDLRAVAPADRAIFFEGLRIEEKFRVSRGNIVRIQEKDLAKFGVEQCKGLEGPSSF